MPVMTQANKLERWDLTRLYTGAEDPALAMDRKLVKDLILDFSQQYRNQVAKLDSQQLFEALRQMEDPINLLDRLAGYTWLLFYTDTREESVRALYQDMWGEYTRLKAEFDFFKTELKYLPQEQMAAHLANPVLAPYHYWLTRLSVQAPSNLSPGQERLLADRSLTSEHAWCQLFTESLARLRLSVNLDSQPTNLSISEARGLRSHINREVRAEAHQKTMEAFRLEGHLFSYILNNLMQHHLDELTIRSLSDLLSPRLDEYDLSRAAVDSLIQTTREHYGLNARYYRSKARLLGIDNFALYDLVAPLAVHHTQVSYNTAKILVKDALRGFSPEFSRMAQRFFADNYIDAFPAPGKPSGSIAFGLGPTVHPYLFLNYTSTVRDVVLLAHELGHGLHYVTAAKTQTALNTYTTAPMLETVSIFTEMLTAEHLLTLEPDPQVRIHVLAAQIENALLNVMRQTMYTEWELNIYAERRNGVLTSDDLNRHWLDAHRALYGDAVKAEEIDGWGWLNNHYFFTARFGNFCYAFGQLLVLSLFTQFKTEGQPFVTRFLAMLEQGGSESPANLLTRLGIDIESPECWQKGFVVLERLIEEFEKAVDAILQGQSSKVST